MTVRGRLIDDAGALVPYLEAWDRLAVARELPYSAPAWALAWWTHAAPAEAALRAVVVLDGDLLIGVAPFYARGRSYALLGGRVAPRVEPLAAVGREEECGRAIAGVLAAGSPRPATIEFEGLPAGSPWPELVRAHWPVPLRSVQRDRVTAPTLSLEFEDLDAYLATRSRNLRNGIKRQRRKIEEHGARRRMTASVQELDADLAGFARLHHARWSGRGGSGALDEGVEALLRAVGRELVGAGRFRLFLIEHGETAISAHLFLAAGGEVAYWLGGFDDDWAEYSPGSQSVLDAVDDALARGDSRIDLGAGEQPYKRRLATGGDELVWTVLVHGRGRSLGVGLGVAAGRAREAVGERLPAGVRHRLGRLLRRGR